MYTYITVHVHVYTYVQLCSVHTYVNFIGIPTIYASTYVRAYLYVYVYLCMYVLCSWGGVVLTYFVCLHTYYVLVSWLRVRSKENCAYISHVAQVSDTAQVTRQVTLLGLIA